MGHSDFSGNVGCEDQRDAFEHLLEARNFALQMFGSIGRDAVGSHPPVGGGNLPFGIDQAGFQQALERGVERAFLYLEQIARALLNMLDHGVSVHRLPVERLQDHEFERTGEQVARFGGQLGRFWGHRLVRNRPRVNKVSSGRQVEFERTGGDCTVVCAGAIYSGFR
jgi:hypothetical protein